MPPEPTLLDVLRQPLFLGSLLVVPLLPLLALRVMKGTVAGWTAAALFGLATLGLTGTVSWWLVQQDHQVQVLLHHQQNPALLLSWHAPEWSEARLIHAEATVKTRTVEVMLQDPQGQYGALGVRLLPEGTKTELLEKEVLTPSQMAERLASIDQKLHQQEFGVSAP